MSKFIFNSYDLLIYPRHLFVVNDGTLTDITKTFIDSKYNPMVLDDDDLKGANALSVPYARDIRTGDHGTLIWFFDSGKVQNSVIAHEAVHAANAIFEQLGIEASNTNDEPMAYLVEYIYRCCEKTIKEECNN